MQTGGLMARQSPPGTLLAERRLPSRPGRMPQPPPAPRAARHVVPVPDLGLKPVEARSPASLRLLSVSILLHAGLAAAVVVVPLLMHDRLPAPASGGRVFFVDPLAIPAPPPPPPPPAPRLVSASRPKGAAPGPCADGPGRGSRARGARGGSRSRCRG